LAHGFLLEFNAAHFLPPFNSSTVDWSMIQNGVLHYRGAATEVKSGVTEDIC
jgi:hypothetical protein